MHARRKAPEPGGQGVVPTAAPHREPQGAVGSDQAVGLLGRAGRRPAHRLHLRGCRLPRHRQRVVARHGHRAHRRARPSQPRGARHRASRPTGDRTPAVPGEGRVPARHRGRAGHRRPAGGDGHHRPVDRGDGGAGCARREDRPARRARIAQRGDPVVVDHLPVHLQAPGPPRPRHPDRRRPHLPDRIRGRFGRWPGHRFRPWSGYRRGNHLDRWFRRPGRCGRSWVRWCGCRTVRRLGFGFDR